MIRTTYTNVFEIAQRVLSSLESRLCLKTLIVKNIRVKQRNKVLSWFTDEEYARLAHENKRKIKENRISVHWGNKEKQGAINECICNESR